MTWERGPEGPEVSAAVGETPKGRAGRRLDTDVDFQGQASDVAELRFRSVCARRRSSAANANVHGVAPPTGRAAGCARGERRWSKDFGPEIVGVSIGWALVARPGGRCRARCGGRGRGLLGQRSPRRVGTRVHRPGSVSSGRSERSAGPSGLRSNGAGRQRRETSQVGCLVLQERWQHRKCTQQSCPRNPFFLGSCGLFGRGSRLMSCRAPMVVGVAGVRPHSVEGRGARCPRHAERAIVDGNIHVVRSVYLVQTFVRNKSQAAVQRISERQPKGMRGRLW